jgi:anaerobic magnesium-protoporphyrin IX monomethyl ester cyclase
VADVLLTHSYHLPFDPKQVRKMQPYPPLGTLYAASVLRSHGISVGVFDTMLQDPSTGFPQSLEIHQPSIVVIYEDDFNFLSKMCLTRMRQVAFEMIEAAVRAHALVIVHGSDATDHALLYLQAGASYVLHGESELRLNELVSVLLRGSDPHELAGIAYLDPQGRMVYSAAQVETAQWLRLPLPARDLIDIDLYRRAWQEAHGYFSLNMVASRGCPYRCNWCAKPISGDRFHVRPAGQVAEELRELRDTYGADHVWFGDDVFALDHRWTLELATEVERRGKAVPFKVQSRADLMTAKTVDCLRRAGCSEVWMGVESGSQEVLDAMEKGLKVEQVMKARKLLSSAGIRSCFFLQFGYPGERWPEIQQTIQLVRETRPDDIGVSVSYPLPNTRFYESVQHQLGAKRNWRDSDDLCATFIAAYRNDFYLALRDALHAEVSSWQSEGEDSTERVVQAWQRVAALEPVSRNADVTELRVSSARNRHGSQVLPVSSLTLASGGV